MNKQRWLDGAEVFDSWRVVPRIIIAVFLAVFAWAVIYFSVSYFRLPPVDRTVTVTAFVSVVLTALTTALPFVAQIYSQKGRDWDAAVRPAPIIITAPSPAPIIVTAPPSSS